MHKAKLLLAKKKKIFHLYGSIYLKSITIWEPLNVHPCALDTELQEDTEYIFIYFSMADIFHNFKVLVIIDF